MTTSRTVTTVSKKPTLTQKFQKLSETLEMVENDRQLLSESLSNAVAMLRQEDIGWAAPGVGQAYRGLTLQELQDWSQQIRASLTGTAERAPNPHMRNGLMLRHSFIWDGDMHYEGVPGTPKSGTAPTRGKKNVYDIMNSPSNKRLIFSAPARRRREEALYSSGLYLLVGENSTKNLRPVPLHEITETQRDELYQDEIIAYRWTRMEAVYRPSGLKGVPAVLTDERQEKSVWVYVDWYTGKKFTHITYNGIREKVLSTHTAFDLHANRPDGQAFGSPDAISALVWARIIRDLIMNGVKMQDALAMFAFKIQSPSKSGQQQVAMELAETHEAGSAAAMGGDNNMVPLSTAGRGYDFQSIGFVVSTMAASLHVSGISLSANTALAGSSYGAAKTLDLPGRMAMQTRRAEHVEFDERLLKWFGADEATAYFDNYDDATDEYRSVQAAMLMWTSGNLTPEGFRAELETIYGRKLLGGIPKGVIIPNNQIAADKAAAKQAEITATTAAPDQGKSTGAGEADHASDLPEAGKK